MRRIFFILILVALAWGGGLVMFIARLPAGATEPPAERHDGIVVFTGAGGPRIASAMTLLDSGAGTRLLISGVNPAISRAELAAMWPGDVAGFDCCVDLGLKAQTTTGNAVEVSEWVNDHNFATIILVTSDYHMPRALLEARDSLPNVQITAYPVDSGYMDADRRPATFAAWRALAREYSKYLAVRVKTFFS